MRQVATRPSSRLRIPYPPDAHAANHTGFNNVVIGHFPKAFVNAFAANRQLVSYFRRPGDRTRDRPDSINNVILVDHWWPTSHGSFMFPEELTKEYLTPIWELIAPEELSSSGNTIVNMTLAGCCASAHARKQAGRLSPAGDRRVSSRYDNATNARSPVKAFKPLGNGRRIVT